MRVILTVMTILLGLPFGIFIMAEAFVFSSGLVQSIASDLSAAFIVLALERGVKLVKCEIEVKNEIQ
jgi:hypothetical protein